jgi:hypothetical protein
LGNSFFIVEEAVFWSFISVICIGENKEIAMPQYTNSGSSVACVVPEGLRIEAGETQPSLSWLLSLPTGVAKTSDLPAWDGDVIASDSLTSTTTVTIPTSVNGVAVRGIRLYIFCASGDWTLVYNGTTPAMYLTAGMPIAEKTRERLINTFTVTLNGAPGKVNYIVWRN